MTEHRFAIIADAHYHPFDCDYGVRGPDGLSLRSWADTRASTRVFNESAAAFEAALDRIEAMGLRDVVLLGDYSDDGQELCVSALLERLAARRNLRFFALPGNHDSFGPGGRDHAKGFLDAAARPVTVSSRSGAGAYHDPRMRCADHETGVMRMAAHGFAPQADVLHWETPFGTDPTPSARRFDCRSRDGGTTLRLFDASYLVEPVPGLWFLMIDANVFEPTGRGDEVIDSTNAGWNALHRVKPHLLRWIAGVSLRAERQGKRLLCFSHYPALDPYRDDECAEERLFGTTATALRRPRCDIGEALCAAGIDVHFSGHLHVRRRSTLHHASRQLVNIAVPSLVAWPAGFCVARTCAEGLTVEDVSLSDLRNDTRILGAYGREDLESSAGVRAAQDYGSFLRAHVDALVLHRYLPREWPAERAAEVTGSLDTALGFAGAAPSGQDLPLLEVVGDWYRLRAAGALGMADLHAERRALYKGLAARLPETAQDQRGAFWALFLRRLSDFVRDAETEAGPFYQPVPALP
ncbi:metallophosphoesterase family protein [Alloyangia pacifica]|uniref:Calcineurin-like phosphoesterase n=1 Tax=Alloyangia pacifica TaxID=311180 RepID=A0A1I6W4Z7_9RHOB|nr:metallophosphoesterase [Alloyangia pacifica]SDI55178.1 Calcineurin-like phosphoesterase [Alloyangia pacifica]SFT21050.1 Calcineurin-like phosphoesterase [Alloyangia pacifica]